MMSKTTPIQWTPKETQILLQMRSQGKTAQEIANHLNRPYRSVTGKIRNLKLEKPAESIADTQVPVVQPAIELPRPTFGHLPLSIIDTGDWVRFGLVADTHLCCKEERLAELHNLYDLFEKEGLTTVFHAGNIIDGYVERINGESVFETTIDGQSQYVANNYPTRKGITTYYITGADHESWFSPGFNIGAYIQYVCENAGRKDLIYIGHVEADVELKGRHASTMLKIMHPGGGSSYARSYTGQKIIESLEGGEKPSILISGHYHLSNYMQERNIHAIALPGMQDQTVFARKKRLRMEVGGAILEFKRNPEDGSVTRCRVEFIRYFTRSYYKAYLKSDAKILKGHLVIPA
jgi:predicted phosphodiesterase